ncbi:MAG: hypothetical protein RLZZ148_2142, partial [Cyanobacteriota bacterium]
PRISPQVPQSCTGRPSVPLSVYRELVKELQATQILQFSLSTSERLTTLMNLSNFFFHFLGYSQAG